jgi:tetratricopeptide (TPR) repeat protein
LAFCVVLAGAWARGPRAAVWFWLGWLPLGMVFHLGWLPVETQFSERYLLLSSIGVAALVALAAGRAADRVPAKRRLVPIGAALALLVLSGLSLHRSGYYRDEFAFTRQWVASDPLHGNAHASLGAALARAGHDDDAIAELREAVRLEPRLASAWYNLGVVLAREGRRHEAIDALTGAVRTDAGDPDIRYALGVLQGERGDIAAAELHLRAALALRPDFPEAAAALERFTAPSPPR